MGLLDSLSGITKSFYGTLFNKNTFMGKVNRTLDPFGREVADDAMERLTPKPPPAPGPAPLAMPDADNEAVAAARRRKMAAMKNRGGRASTILGGEDSLGG